MSTFSTSRTCSQAPPVRRRPTVLLRTTAVVLMLTAGLAACAEPTTEGASESTFAGVPLESPASLPNLRFPSTLDGDSTALRDVLDRPVNLLFIGFTNCPDICPVHLANLGAVMRELPLEQEREIAVAFVTADPARDSLSGIAEWLDALHDDFVGFRPDIAGVNALEDSLGIPRSVVDPSDESGEYLVAHASQIIAFDAQGRARLAYPWGIRQRDWKADLPRLIRGEWPELPGAPESPDSAAVPPTEDVR